MRKRKSDNFKFFNFLQACTETNINNSYPAPYSKPEILETFTPHQFLPRARLPLSFLDTATTYPLKPSNPSKGHNKPSPVVRLFSSGAYALRVLEEKNRNINRNRDRSRNGDRNSNSNSNSNRSRDRSAEHGPGPLVLVVTSSDGRLYVVESMPAPAREGTFALCRLAEWVTVGELVGLPEGVAGWRSRALKMYGRKCVGKDMGRDEDDGGHGDNDDWWRAAALPYPTAEQLARKRRRVGGPVLVMGWTGTLDKTVEGGSIPVVHAEKEGDGEKVTSRKIDSTVPSGHADVDGSEGRVSSISPDEAYATLVHHYLEQLYHSKTSLAYFAKGPLSRLRAAAATAGEEGSALSLHDITTFLRSITLTPTLLEKKYKETLPEVIRNAVTTYPSDDGEDDLPFPSAPHAERTKQRKGAKTSKSKSRKVKVKLRKNGLFTGEEENVRRWWWCWRPGASDDCPGSEPRFVSRVEASKVHLGALRLREIFAQVIVALEILALEESSAWKRERGGEACEDGGEKGGCQGKKSKGRKSKKTQDVRVVLDLLVDKLCIWRSVDQLEAGFGQSAHAGGEQDGKKGGKSDDADGSDVLVNFCVEVVIPL